MIGGLFVFSDTQYNTWTYMGGREGGREGILTLRGRPLVMTSFLSLHHVNNDYANTRLYSAFAPRAITRQFPAELIG